MKSAGGLLQSTARARAGFYSSDVRFVGTDEGGNEVATTLKARLRVGKDGVGDIGVSVVHSPPTRSLKSIAQ